MDSCDFTFDGRHVSEFGAAFLASKWPGIAAAAANEASVSGRHGTMRYGGEAYAEKPFEGTLYLLEQDGGLLTYARMLERMEAIGGWLSPGGRRRLVLDALPDRFYMAEHKQAIALSTDGWDHGKLALRFALQPFCYAAQESAVVFSLAANAAQTKTLYVPGNMPGPLLLKLTARAAVGWAEVLADGRLLRAEGLGLGAGGVLEIAAPLELGEMMTCTLNGAPGMSRVTAASSVPCWVRPGAQPVRVTASGACEVRAAVRGRWK